MMMEQENKKFHNITVKRRETEHIWGNIKVGSVIELKYKKNKGFKNGSYIIIPAVEKYKVLSKKHGSMLVEKVRNGFKETFTFGDFITDDVTI